jgi:hypothetical protein
MRYRLMASYQGASYQASVGPSDDEVTLFAACPPPETLGFRSSAGHWRKQVSADEIDSLWESRPIGRYRGEPCMVLDDLHDRLHITYLGHELHKARRLGYWEVDRGVFEIVVPRQEIGDLREERADYELAMPEPADEDPRDAGPWAAQGAGVRDLVDTGPQAPRDMGSWAARDTSTRNPRDTGSWSARGTGAQDPRDTGAWAARDVDPRESGAQPLRGRGGWHERDTGGWEAPDTGTWAIHEAAVPDRQEPDGWDPQARAAWNPASTGEWGPPGLRRQPGPPDPPRAADSPDVAAWNPRSADAAHPWESSGMPGSRPAAEWAPAEMDPAPRQQRTPDAAAVWHGSPAPGDAGPWNALMPADAPAVTQRPAIAGSTGPSSRTEPAFSSPMGPAAGASFHTVPGAEPGPAFTSPPGITDPFDEPVIVRDSAATGEHAATAGRAAGRRRRAAGKAHVTTQSFFMHLCEQASIPQSAYAVGEEIDGAMCLMRTDGGYEVFSSVDRVRREARFFEDEDAAYFYLFGILAAEAVRSGYLRPQTAQPAAHQGPGPEPGPPAGQPGTISIRPGATSIRPGATSIRFGTTSMPPRR